MGSVACCTVCSMDCKSVVSGLIAELRKSETEACKPGRLLEVVGNVAGGSAVDVAEAGTPGLATSAGEAWIFEFLGGEITT